MAVNPGKFYPNLEGNREDDSVFREKVANGLRIAFDYIHSHSQDIGAVNNKQETSASKIATDLTFTNIRNQLQLNGSAPLNVYGLIGSQSVIQDLYANRPVPGSQLVGTWFWATDYTTLWVNQLVSGASQWVYVAGMYRAVVASIPTTLISGDDGFLFLGTDRNWVWRWSGTAFVLQDHLSNIYRAALASIPTLGVNDAGAQFFVTDYTHLLRWTGTAWEFGPGDFGSGHIQGFAFAPPGGTWQICDGTAVNYLKADGTTANFTTPNLTGHYVKFDNGGYVATAAASGTTADESAHTHDPGTFAVSGTTGASGAGTVEAGTGSDAVGDHAHGFSASVTGTSAAGTAHNHGPGTLELAHTELIPYFRR